MKSLVASKISDNKCSGSWGIIELSTSARLCSSVILLAASKASDAILGKYNINLGMRIK